MHTMMPRLEPLFSMALRAGGSRDIGTTPQGRRRVVRVAGGSFAGAALKGEVLPGEDWITERPDGTIQLDVRLPLVTQDGHGILMRYHGFRHGPADVMARMAQGEDVPPTEYYFRIAPVFETAAEPYGWLNRVVAIGSGWRQPDAVLYDIWQAL